MKNFLSCAPSLCPCIRSKGFPKQFFFYRGHGNPSWHANIKLAEGRGQLVIGSIASWGRYNWDDGLISSTETDRTWGEDKLPGWDDCWHLFLACVCTMCQWTRRLFSFQVCVKKTKRGVKLSGITTQKIIFHWYQIHSFYKQTTIRQTWLLLAQTTEDQRFTSQNSA